MSTAETMSNFKCRVNDESQNKLNRKRGSMNPTGSIDLAVRNTSHTLLPIQLHDYFFNAQALFTR